MASGYRDKKGWVISFRHIGEKGTKRTRKRLPAKYATNITKTKADKLAGMVDTYCRAVERDRDPHAIAWLLDAGFLTEEQAKRVARVSVETLEDLKPRPAPHRVTIREAALENPSVARERENNPRDYRYHLGKLDAFIAWAEIHRLEHVTVKKVRQYVEHLRAKGVSPRTRKASIYYLRLACSMSPSLCGSPDVLKDHRLDQNESSKPDVKAYTGEELKAIIEALEDGKETRLKAAFGLMLMLSLGPSECARLDVGDVDLDERVLKVGERRAKNDYRKRELPICDTLAEWLSPLVKRARKGRALIHNSRAKNARLGMSVKAIGVALRPYLRASGQNYTQEALRSTFATVALLELEIEPRDVEAFLGHVQQGKAAGAESIVSAITAKHYVAASVDRLRPVAERFEAWLLKVLE